MDFGELKSDINFITKVKNINNALDKIEKSFETAFNYENYDELTLQEKVKLELFLSYSINSLYWMYMKLQGSDPNNHDIKNELSRVRQTMLREKQIHERNTIRPVLDKAAAGRFIRHGLHDRSGRKDTQKEAELEQEKENNDKSNDGEEKSYEPCNKKIKFNDDDDN